MTNRNMTHIGCSDPYHTQDDGTCYCKNCSMGEDSDECEEFRKDNKLELIYKI